MSADKRLATHHATLDMVFFSTGRWRVGIEAGWVRGARPASPADWAGNPARAAALLNFPAGFSSAKAPQWLSLKGFGQDHQILVEGPVELLRLALAAIHPLPPLLAARTRLRGLQALGLLPHAGPGELALLFDGAQLCRHATGLAQPASPFNGHAFDLVNA